MFVFGGQQGIAVKNKFAENLFCLKSWMDRQVKHKQATDE